MFACHDFHYIARLQQRQPLCRDLRGNACVVRKRRHVQHTPRPLRSQSEKYRKRTEILHARHFPDVAAQTGVNAERVRGDYTTSPPLCLCIFYLASKICIDRTAFHFRYVTFTRRTNETGESSGVTVAFTLSSAIRLRMTTSPSNENAESFNSATHTMPSAISSPANRLEHRRSVGLP